MELLLNEKSLDGQFQNQDDFYQTLPVMSMNLGILRKLKISLMRHSSLYNRRITKDMTILDLQNRKGKVDPIYRDQVKKWKRELSSLIMEPPFWDEELSECDDSLEEAARRRTDVISFPHVDYQDRILNVIYKDEVVDVKSAVTTRYLLGMLWQCRAIKTFDYLKLRYREGRLRTDFLDIGMKSIEELQKTEVEELLAALERFETKSWPEIQQDKFFCYKSYQPSSKKQNYFLHTAFADKKMDKFRCGKHSQIRCFGYREGECFYILMVERDHSVSDTG